MRERERVRTRGKKAIRDSVQYFAVYISTVAVTILNGI